MSSEKYIGLDVHQATISVAVLDSRGKLVMESIVETKAATILDFFAGLRGTLSVTFEEGTWAAWLWKQSSHKVVLHEQDSVLPVSQLSSKCGFACCHLSAEKNQLR